MVYWFNSVHKIKQINQIEICFINLIGLQLTGLQLTGLQLNRFTKLNQI